MERNETRQGDSRSAWGPLAGTRYRTVRRIGGGAASDVFEAVGPLGEVRAVKLLRAEHADSNDVTWRLTQEGRALARLDHPNLVKVIDAGVTAAGRPFLVMPRLIGETLRERLDREGRLAPRAACELVAGALDGLDCAHAAGIVHRDIKPANVFLAKEARLRARRAARLRDRQDRGRVVRADDGIARARYAEVRRARADPRRRDRRRAPTSTRSASCSSRRSRAGRLTTRSVRSR